jgi:G:T-mismatch repair DNA endonuclease (very short patch repair protein)
MSQILGYVNLKTEVRLSRMMMVAGIKGWRSHLPIPGRPDFSIKNRRCWYLWMAVFSVVPYVFSPPKAQPGVLEAK